MANRFVSSSGPKGNGSGDSEENAWSLTYAITNAYARDYVWIKNDGVYAGTFTVGCSGSQSENTHIYFIGYNNFANCDLVNHISDMDLGQPFWGGPMNPNSLNCWVDINGMGAAGNVVYQYQKNNIHWRNIHFHNSNKSAYNCAYYLKYSNNSTFTKCKFTDSYINLWVDTNSQNNNFKYCYFENYTAANMDISSGSMFILISQSVFAGGLLRMYRSICCHNLFIGGSYGIGAYSFQNIVFNNVMYNQTSHCLGYGSNTSPGSLTEYNNIFIPAGRTIPAIYKNGSGTLAFSGYGCAYCISEDCILDDIYAGEKGFNVNPQFVNASENNFRILNPSLLRGGMPDCTGTSSQIGAILQQYQFPQRARAANRAKLSIFK
ncbi:MAG: hypothetical protein ABFD79_05965 [Phycisphaerales bacterium]